MIKTKIHDLLDRSKNLETELEDIKRNYFTKTNESIVQFSNEINLINSRRERLWQDLKKLHVFFEDLGNLEKMKYENFKKEISIGIEDNFKILEINDTLKKVSENVKNMEIHSLADYGVNFFKSGLFGLRESYRNNDKIEVEVENYLKKIKNIENELKKYKGDLDLKKDYIEMCEKITVEYRILINELSDFLEMSIFPEMEMIKLFLFTHSIKDKILFGELTKNTKIEPTKISQLSESLYKKHYLFIQNTFLLFQIIQSFFSQDVITNLMSASDLESEAQKINSMVKIENQINQIKNQKEKIKENAIYGEM